MSGGLLEDVSILDLPAFASSIGTLERNQKRESGWPTELNFAILKTNEGANVSSVMAQYKVLLEHWNIYMEKLENPDDSEIYWTDEMSQNDYLNFTKYVEQDMKTFFMALSGIDIYHIFFL